MSALRVADAAPARVDELESTETALDEVTRLYVQADARRGALGRRRAELLMGAKELRRKRARNDLDAFLPPLELISIEYASVPVQTPGLREALPVLFWSLVDVWRIWRHKYLRRGV